MTAGGALVEVAEAAGGDEDEVAGEVGDETDTQAERFLCHFSESALCCLPTLFYPIC